MTTKFEVERVKEVDGKLKAEKLTIELASPPFKLKKRIYQCKWDYAEKIKGAKERIDASPTNYKKEDYDLVVDTTIAMARAYNEEIVKLCINDAVKTADDMEGIGEEYLAQMRTWLDQKLGIVEDKSKEGFTKT